MIQTLVSEKNPLLKEVRRAIAQGTLTENGCAVAEGPRLLDEALASGIEIAAVISSESCSTSITSRFSRLRENEEVRLISVSDRVFGGLTTTEHPQGIITLVQPRNWILEDVFSEHALAVVLDGLQDPGNAGAVVRSAEAFGSTGVVFLKGSVNPYNSKCMRASAGSLFRLPVVAGVEDRALEAALEASAAVLYTAMPRADHTLDQASLTKSCGIIIGGEGKGVRATLAARAHPLRIPTTGVESLNAAVACGVLLYEARRQRSRA